METKLQLPKNIENSINMSNEIIQKTLGNNLVKIILFGSYSRGDYTKESDIDLCVLTDLDRNQNYEILKMIADKIYDIDLKNDVLINPFVENYDFYLRNNDTILTFNNIDKEGVAIYG